MLLSQLMLCPSWTLYKHVLEAELEPRVGAQRTLTEQRLRRDDGYEVWFTPMTGFGREYERSPDRVACALLVMVHWMVVDAEWRNDVMGVADDHPWWVFTKDLLARWHGPKSRHIDYNPTALHPQGETLYPADLTIPQLIRLIVDHWIITQ